VPEEQKKKVYLQKGDLLPLDRQSIRVPALTFERICLLFQPTGHRNAWAVLKLKPDYQHSLLIAEVLVISTCVKILIPDLKSKAGESIPWVFNPRPTRLCFVTPCHVCKLHIYYKKLQFNLGD